MPGNGPSEPIYIGSGTTAAFGQFHAAGVGRSVGTAVLICPPWGWEEIASYRARREWAGRLAADGHPTLRLDFPATGDSAGLPEDAALVATWIASVNAAIAWLRVRTGTRVSVVGLGVGGLIAVAAVASGASVEDLVLWATPAGGRAFVRSQRAFASLQTSRSSLSGGPELEFLPDGGMEIGGFVLSGETIRALEGLTIGGLDRVSVRRALLLSRDGIPVDPGLRQHLVDGGAETGVEAGPGWEAMCFHPERYAPPNEVIDRVTAWFDSERREAVGAPAKASGPEGGRTEPIVELQVDGVAIRERPLWLPNPTGRTFAILTQPVEPAEPATTAATTDGTAHRRTGVVFLNAGAVRRVGPNRIWVEAARRWAARGVASIRVDLAAIGDSDGDADRFRDVGEFYTAEQGAGVATAIDTVVANGAERVVLVGLCAGAYWAFHVAATDRRVTSAILLNSRALVWDTGLETRREARRIGGILQRRWWLRAIRGQVEIGRVRSVGRAAVARLGSVARARSRKVVQRRGGDEARSIAALLASIQRLDGRLVIAFSGDEVLRDELVRDGSMARFAAAPNVVLEDLPGRDHTVRPIVAQEAVHNLLDRELAREVSGRGGPGLGAA